MIASKYLYSEKEGAMKILKALNINPKISYIRSKTSINPFIELDCEVDVVFTGSETKVYGDILNYFKWMLD